MEYTIKVNLDKVGGILPDMTTDKRHTAKIIKEALEKAGAIVVVKLEKEVTF